MAAWAQAPVQYRRLWNLCNVKAYSDPYKGGHAHQSEPLECVILCKDSAISCNVTHSKGSDWWTWSTLMFYLLQRFCNLLYLLVSSIAIQFTWHLPQVWNVNGTNCADQAKASAPVSCFVIYNLPFCPEDEGTWAWLSWKSAVVYDVCSTNQQSLVILRTYTTYVARA